MRLDYTNVFKFELNFNGFLYCSLSSFFVYCILSSFFIYGILDVFSLNSTFYSFIDLYYIFNVMLRFLS